MSITAVGPGQRYFPLDVVENSFQFVGQEVSSGGLRDHRGGMAVVCECWGAGVLCLNRLCWI
jgi:hypothetical protein